jgi:acetyl esterase/lipase
VAAAAPATDLLALFAADRETASGRSLTSMALMSWSRVFNLPLDEFVADRAKHHFEALANDCIETLSDFIKEDHDEQVLEREFLKIDPLSHARVREIMSTNSTAALPTGTPVFLSQGSADDLVQPHITHAYMQRICNGGAKVKLHVMNGGGHMFAGRDSANAAVEWITARFKGHAAPNDCR